MTNWENINPGWTIWTNVNWLSLRIWKQHWMTYTYINRASQLKNLFNQSDLQISQSRNHSVLMDKIFQHPFQESLGDQAWATIISCRDPNAGGWLQVLPTVQTFFYLEQCHFWIATLFVARYLHTIPRKSDSLQSAMWWPSRWWRLPSPNMQEGRGSPPSTWQGTDGVYDMLQSVEYRFWTSHGLKELPEKFKKLDMLQCKQRRRRTIRLDLQWLSVSTLY